ncbi:MAG: carbon-nitrogen hydrolase family protein [Betaproteobacteria bacterium]|nr:MAG: carbon-nitrogen hydrolase family protein [Betaproteobacteria bacterium]
MTALTVACIQLNAGNDVEANLAGASQAIRDAAGKGAQLVALPEYCVLLDGSGRIMRERSPEESRHPALPVLRDLARETGAWLLIGSLTVRLSDERMANRSYLVSAAGEIVARYDKIHMFDVTLPGGKVIRESSAYHPGERAVLAHTPWGPLGMSVCYDLRFPHLYRALAKAGALILAVPSSFQRETGPAHWHTLLRARAIESAAWVIAPAMCGEHPNGRSTYGHSLVIDPWGKIVAELDDRPGVLVAQIDLEQALKVRSMLPSLQHDRTFEVQSEGTPTGQA